MEVCFCYFCNIETALSEDGLWAPMSQNCSSNGLLEKKFVCRPVKSSISHTGVGGDLRFRHQRTSPAFLWLQKGWADFTWSLNSQIFHMALNSSWAETFPAKVSVVTAFCTMQFKYSEVGVWKKKVGFMMKNQNFFMLNLQVSSLKLQIQTAFRLLWSSGLTTGECTFQGDLSSWPKILSWSWGEKVDSAYKGFQEIQVSNPGDGSELWPCKPPSGMGNKWQIILL